MLGKGLKYPQKLSKLGRPRGKEGRRTGIFRKQGRIPTGRSAAWLARLVRDQEVASSNLAAPTILFRLRFLFNGHFPVYRDRQSFQGDGDTCVRAGGVPPPIGTALSGKVTHPTIPCRTAGQGVSPPDDRKPILPAIFCRQSASQTLNRSTSGKPGSRNQSSRDPRRLRRSFPANRGKSQIGKPPPSPE